MAAQASAGAECILEPSAQTGEVYHGVCRGAAIGEMGGQFERASFSKSADGCTVSVSMNSGLSEEELAKILGVEKGVETEKKLQALLQKKQRELEECTALTCSLPSAQKKRMRNRHASSVSRIKKKLLFYTLQRELEASRLAIQQLGVEVRGQRGSIQYFQKENARLRKALERYTRRGAMDGGTSKVE